MGQLVKLQFHFVLSLSLSQTIAQNGQTIVEQNRSLVVLKDSHSPFTHATKRSRSFGNYQRLYQKYTLSIFVRQPFPSARWNLPKTYYRKTGDPTYFSHVLSPWLTYYVIKYFVNQRSQNKPLLIRVTASPSFERIISYNMNIDSRSHIQLHKSVLPRLTSPSPFSCSSSIKLVPNLRSRGSAKAFMHSTPNHRKREK